MRKQWVKIGAIGTVISAICCFTPLLVVALSALGMSLFIGYLDVVLFPAMGLFITLLLIGLIKKRGNSN
ncbi:MAG: mercury resistance system transport protein MerF [Aliivibrio sp.]|uniref:mercury resistance system transport protein MerF n=1 Tax=Aliivibrio sp. TaxID=1872443 RepID=UPI001A5AA413|nr:mercury resistance system transport protein MerF [Aliivibrio sp.]